jgi:hypothetical protein
MAESNLHLTLVPDLHDPPVPSEASQQELEKFRDSLQAGGIPSSYGVQLRESAEGAAILQGDFTIRLLTALGPVLGTAAGAWLHARCGRTVRLKVGEFEGEAQTVQELQHLVQLADEYERQHRRDQRRRSPLPRRRRS